MNGAGLGLAGPMEEPDPKSAVSRQIDAERSSAPQAASRPAVVLVEDSNSDAYLVRLALERVSPKPELTHFRDPEKALECLASLAGGAVPDLLILDLNIPRKDGFEVLAALREMPGLCGMAVLVLTSSISPEDRRRATACGVRRFLSKPMMLDDFLRTVGAAVQEAIREARTRGASS